MLILRLAIVGFCAALVSCARNEPSIFRDNDKLFAQLNQQQPAAAGSGAQVADSRVADLIAADVLRFGFKVGQSLIELPQNHRFAAFSPLSVMAAMALLMLGAKGHTYQELSQLFPATADMELRGNPSKLHEQFALLLDDLQKDDWAYISPSRSLDGWRYTVPHYSPVPMLSTPNARNEYLVKLANGLFAQTNYNLNPNYRQVITSIYRSELAQFDFEKEPEFARQSINRWVSEKTFGKIPTIFDERLERETKVIIASALYFKGHWEYPFLRAVTRTDKFYPNGMTEASINVNYMTTIGNFPYYESAEYGCRIIGLPYKGNLSTMYIVQPNNSDRAKLRQLQAELNEQRFEDMVYKMSMASVALTLPKMRISQSNEMTNHLKKLGIQSVFEAELSDLSLIGGDGQPARKGAPQAAVARPRQPLTKAAQQELQPAQQRPQPATNLFDRYNEIPLIFTRSGFSEASAELSGLRALEAQRPLPSPQQSQLYVDEVLHKVDIDINEEGTEAAAATAINFKKSGPEIYWQTDAPFMFVIRHDATRLPMFYGIVNEPPSA